MKTLAYILILITLFYMLPSPTEAGTSARGIRDAREDAQRDINKGLWFMTGFCLSGLGYTIAFLTTPELPVDRFMGKPPEYLYFYMQEYERKTKRLQAYYSFWGSVTAVGTVTGLTLLNALRLGRVF